MSRHRSGKCTKTLLKHWTSPRTVVSIILKWKKFGTGQTEQSGEMGLGQGGDQEPDGHFGRAPEFLCGRTTISAALHQSGLYSRVARRTPLLSKRYMTARLEFAKRLLKDSQTMRNMVSGLMKPRLSCLAWMSSSTSGGNLAPSLQWSMLVAASCCGDVFGGRDLETSQGKDERSNVHRDPWWKPASEHSGSQTGAKVNLPNGVASGQVSECPLVARTEPRLEHL